MRDMIDENCCRCQKPIDESGLPTSEALTNEDGEVIGVICEDCITPEEQQTIDEEDMFFTAALEQFINDGMIEE
jgi:hypothetical protein